MLKHQRTKCECLQRVRGLVIAATILLAFVGPEVRATPQFARTHNMRCNACHVVVPRLNTTGLAFKARGYRLPSELDNRLSELENGLSQLENEPSEVENAPPELENERALSLPFALWLTGSHEHREANDFSETLLPKVEIISGGPIGDNLSYFVEWRAVSRQTRSDGSIRDRSGRFEDAFIEWSIDDRSSLTLGQYRALNQVDVSQRLSISEPALFSTSLAGSPSSNKRLESVRSFSPAGRSPGLTYSFQSIFGELPSDGLFHFVTLPFPGELSVPLTSKARDEASFELHGEPKGVFLETFYRSGLNSIGLHSFIDDDRWLLTAVGTLNFDNFHITGGIGIDDRHHASARVRSSLEMEYLYARDIEDMFRPGVGFRVEHVSHDGRDPAYIPYFVLAGPNTSYTSLLQVEYRAQEDNEAFFLNFSLLF